MGKKKGDYWVVIKLNLALNRFFIKLEERGISMKRPVFSVLSVFMCIGILLCINFL